MLKRKLNYAWRLFATGLSFTTFGVGGIAIATIISPTVKLFKRDTEQQQQLAQHIIKYGFRGFVEMMQHLGIMTCHIEGLDKLSHSRGEIIIANHPTLIDVVVLIAMLPQANCVVKQSLWQNPFTRGPVRSAGYILNLGSQQFIDACVLKLQQDNAASLVIFPEGTRTQKNQQLNEFQRGAANIALRAQVPLRPVIIRCTPSTLTKNEKWYQIPDRPFHLELKVMDVIDPRQVVSDQDISPKAVRRLNVWLYNFFRGELCE